MASNRKGKSNQLKRSPHTHKPKQKLQNVKTFKWRRTKTLSPNSENINVYPDYKPKPPPVLTKMQTQEGALLCPREGKNLARPPACQGPFRFAPLPAPLRFAPLRSALDRRALAGYLVPGRGQSKAQQSSPTPHAMGQCLALYPSPPLDRQCSFRF